MNYPKKSYGQHFLVNTGAADGIVAAAGIVQGQPVLEVGPGGGVLTGRLLAAGARLAAVEADHDLEPVLRAKFPALELYMEDALRFDFGRLGHEPRTLVSNLPYNVSKPLLKRFFEERNRFPRWVLMMQKEVGERLTAVPRTKPWGPLGILMQNVCEIRRIAVLGPQSFKPPPKVDSAVLCFDVRPAPLAPMPPGDGAFGDALFTLFRERRKTLSNRMKGMGLAGKGILEKHGLTGRERAEELSHLAILALVADIATATRP